MAEPATASPTRLRDFSALLAERLQAAPSRRADTMRLAVRIGGYDFLFSLAAAGEILAREAIVAVPWTQPWFRGLARARGRLVSVIDLPRFLGRPPQAREEPGQLLVLGDALEVNVAFLITRASGLRDRSRMQVIDDAAGAPRSPWETAILRDTDGSEFIELDVAGLVVAESFNLVGR